MRRLYYSSFTVRLNLRFTDISPQSVEIHFVQKKNTWSNTDLIWLFCTVR